MYPVLMTAKQETFIRRLVAEGRDVWQIPDRRLGERAFDVLGGGKEVGAREASQVIDALLQLPRPPSNVTPPTQPGMYRDPVDGTIFKVQKAKGTDHLYAKRLQPIGGQRLTDTDEIVHFEFAYEPGAMHRIDNAWRMTVEQAREFGLRFGVCCVCGRTLKDADSVKAGIGPKCAKGV